MIQESDVRHDILWCTKLVDGQKLSEWGGPKKEKNRMKSNRVYTEKTFYLLLLEITILAIIPTWATGCGGRAGNGDDTGVVVKLLCVFSTNPCQEHQILAFYYKDPSSPAFSTHFFIESGFRDMT